MPLLPPPPPKNRLCVVPDRKEFPGRRGATTLSNCGQRAQRANKEERERGFREHRKVHFCRSVCVELKKEEERTDKIARRRFLSCQNQAGSENFVLKLEGIKKFAAKQQISHKVSLSPK